VILLVGSQGCALGFYSANLWCWGLKPPTGCSKPNPRRSGRGRPFPLFHAACHYQRRYSASANCHRCGKCRSRE